MSEEETGSSIVLFDGTSLDVCRWSEIVREDTAELSGG